MKLAFEVGLRVDWVRRVSHVLGRVAGGIGAVSDGIGFGLLRHGEIDQVVSDYYQSGRSWAEGLHNARGLFGWDQRVAHQLLAANSRILLVAAGGGREVLALTLQGHLVEAYECEPSLVVAANVFLASVGQTVRISHLTRNKAPADGGPVDVVWIGWGAYTHIMDRTTRILFLRGLASRLVSGGKLVVSFWTRDHSGAYYSVCCALANTLRLVTGGRGAERGDTLQPLFGHCFDRGAIGEELSQAGFVLSHYRSTPYGHAVAKFSS